MVEEVVVKPTNFNLDIFLGREYGKLYLLGGPIVF